MDEITQILRDNNPNLKASSLTQYVCNVKKTLEMIEGGMDDPMNTLMNKSDEIIEAIEPLNENTQRNKLNAIIKVVGKEGEVAKNYIDRRDLLQSRYNDQRESGQKTPKEEARMITTEQYNDVLTDLHEKIKGLSKDDLPLKKTQWRYWIAYMLLSLYKEIPLRNDLAGMKVITNDTWRNHRYSLDNDKNYMVVGARVLNIVLNQYKTNKTYGRKIIKTSPELAKIIRRYLTLKPKNNNYLVVNHSGDVMSDTTLSRFISNIFLEFLDTQTGITALRKSYLTNKYGDIKQEMAEDAHKMGHSVQTQQKIYVRK